MCQHLIIFPCLGREDGGGVVGDRREREAVYEKWWREEDGEYEEARGSQGCWRWS